MRKNIATYAREIQRYFLLVAIKEIVHGAIVLNALKRLQKKKCYVLLEIYQIVHFVAVLMKDESHQENIKELGEKKYTRNKWVRIQLFLEDKRITFWKIQRKNRNFFGSDVGKARFDVALATALACCICKTHNH